MLTSLFRKQAVAHQQNRLHGEVMVIPGFPYVICTIFLFLWLSAVIAWLVNSQYARKETVFGWLEPPSGLIRVFPESNQGKIKQILVKQGQQVDISQPLMIINGDRFLTDGASLEQKLLQEYQQQKRIYQQQLRRTDSIHELETAEMTAQITASQEDLSRLDSQIKTLEQRQKLQQKRVQNYNKMLNTGHLSDVELDNARQQLLALRNDYQQLLREKVNQKNAISRLNTQLILAPQHHQNERTQVNAKLSEINQQIEQINGQRTHVIRATRAGIVTSLQAKIGQRVNLNTPLLTLIPINTEIEAKLLVPVRAAGFIEQAQNIEIRYDAFPYQKFGLYRGEITDVAESITLPGELHSSPIHINEPVYLVNARLHQQYVTGYGRSLALKSGMTLSADIKLGNRSMLEWLFEPIYSLKGKL